MESPAILATHYSSKAFATRMAAIVFVGSVVGATFKEVRCNKIAADIVGFAVILVPVLLAELNRRYTHAYKCACLACTMNPDDPISRMWKSFCDTNEQPWKKWYNRFFLSWSTYIPGVLLGPLIIYLYGHCPVFIICSLLSFVAVGLWIIISCKQNYRVLAIPKSP